jgi:flagella basal body P-ring formation protein FlgA
MAVSKTAWKIARGAALACAAALLSGPVFAASREIPVPKLVIYPGEVIAEAALETRPVNAPARLPVAVTTSDVTGKVARRTLLPGQAIPLSALRVPEVVSQGKTYRIQFNQDGLIISGVAVALTSGAAGDAVSLRNPDSGTVVRGIVAADGTVRVGLP